LRLVGTLNNTANTLVRALDDLQPSTWDFDTLADEILPFTRVEIHSLTLERTLRKQLRTSRPPEQFTAATLWEGRLSELQALRKYRYERGKLPGGQRSSWLFIAGVAMSWIAPPTAMQRELYGLAREVAGWSGAESKTRMQAAIKRARMAGQGETVEWNGRRIDARFQFKDKTIIEWLGITDEEMAELKFKHLLHDHMKRERKREKDRKYDEQRRREAGAITRDQYEQQATERRKQALVLRQNGLSYRKIADRLQCSKSEIERLIKSVQGSSHCMVAKPPSPSL